MPKVLISDSLSPRAVDIFAARGIEAEVKTGMKPDELIAAIAEYDGLAVRSATKVTPEVIAAAENLKVVGRAGIGVDNIDLDAATARGIVVMNTPHGNAVTTAEHTVAMMFALAREIPAADRSTQAGQWEKSRFMGVELTGKTLGIIGCGNIGSIVAERGIGLKMKVIAYDPYLSPERAADLGVEKVELDELLARADFITLHTPLTEATQNIIDADTLSKTKKGVFLINCARGELMVEDAVREALGRGDVAGVAMDVFAEEPPKGFSLFGMEGFIATPHLGAATTEAQEKVALQIAEQMSDFLLSGAVTNAVNMDSVTAEEAPRLAPYMRLAKQLGSFAGQLTETGLKTVGIEYEGLAAELNTKPLTACVLQGLLAPILDSVNMVNAPALARERDIGVTETVHQRASEYQTLIRLTVTTETRQHTVAGTLFGGDKPRIVDVNGIPLEAELGPCMLYTVNKDLPGTIGGLGDTLGQCKVNIATFNLGRTGPGGDAVAIMAVDETLTEEILAKIRAIPNVIEAKALNF